MTQSLGNAAGVRVALALAAWLTSSHLASAQDAAAMAHPSTPARAPRRPVRASPPHHEQPPAGACHRISVAAHLGFRRRRLRRSEQSEGPRGFSEGQFTLHLVSALSPRVAFFGELSFTPRADAGTGSPPATGFNAEVERVIIRFDQSDRLKVSFGRYHTPINWWNTAFHHGQWLQTTISRPEMVQFGGKIHSRPFRRRARRRGRCRRGGWNVNYQAGVGNGRGNVISRAGDAGDNNARPACVLNLFAKPDALFGLQVGGIGLFRPHHRCRAARVQRTDRRGARGVAARRSGDHRRNRGRPARTGRGIADDVQSGVLRAGRVSTAVRRPGSGSRTTGSSTSTSTRTIRCSPACRTSTDRPSACATTSRPTRRSRPRSAFAGASRISRARTAGSLQIAFTF